MSEYVVKSFSEDIHGAGQSVYIIKRFFVYFLNTSGQLFSSLSSVLSPSVSSLIFVRYTSPVVGP